MPTAVREGVGKWEKEGKEGKERKEGRVGERSRAAPMTQSRGCPYARPRRVEGPRLPLTNGAQPQGCALGAVPRFGRAQECV